LVIASGAIFIDGGIKFFTREDGKKLPSGKTRAPVKVHLRDKVVVRLDQRPSLGLRWVESPDSTKLLEVKSRKSAPNAKSKSKGVGGGVEDVILMFRFKADAAPTDEPQYLRLNLVRGRSTEAIDTFEVPIQVVK
jgi:hypothetical protein